MQTDFSIFYYYYYYYYYYVKISSFEDSLPASPLPLKKEKTARWD